MEQAQPGSVDDLTTLAKLDERILLEELRERYRLNKIYTFVGDILVAVNPYRDIGIYGDSESRRYRDVRKSSNPPHIFAVADMAYQAMLGHGGIRPTNQCVLISGESGAGKTESTKLIIKQVVELCRGNSQLEQQILQVNPLLEAFGNAQTVMNDNSSRFGKYIQLRFQAGHLMGAKISEYLLEKSRVVRQNSGEENFHIFHYLFSVQNSVLATRLRLGDPARYRYLTQGAQSVVRDRRLMRRRYDDLLNAMDLVGFTDEEQADVFTSIAGVLHLGNVDFATDEQDASHVTDMNAAVQTATELLGLAAEDVAACLTSSCWVQQGEYIKRNYTQAMAEDARDAMAKAIYGRLFGWIVNMVNSLLRPSEPIDPKLEREIGILDIFGFEHFETNSFEQACINLANEQLQFFFNQHIFKMEQEEYIREGIDWTEIKFVDNKPLLDLFLARPIGLLALLDEESLFPRGTDQSFVEKVTTHFHKHQNFVKPPQSRTVSFSIQHYAGKVTYDASRWLEKNRDTLPSGIMEMLQASRNQLVKTVFRGSISRTGTLSLQGRRTLRSKMSKKRPESTAGNAAKNKVTVGGQFKKSLTILMERMTASSPIFVRCLKPNHQKTPGVFDEEYILAQLLYTGMLETVKIRREGFAFRPSFDDFVLKYKIILGQPRLKGNMENSLKILKAARIHGYCMGKTKVFLKLAHMEKLTEVMDNIAKAAIHVQRVVRGFLARRRCQYRLLEAKRQAQLAELLLRQAMENSDSALARQQALVDVDSRSRQQGRQPGTAAPPVPQFPTPLYQTAIPGGGGLLPAQPGPSGYLEPRPSHFVSTGTQMEDEGADSDEILEDSFDPPVAMATQTTPKEWFSKTTQVEQVFDGSKNKFQEWFHGVISRRESESLLRNQPVGCFLIRVSESRFGYTLSFRAEDRTRHYMISQLKNHKFLVIGENKVHRTLQDLVEYYRKNKLSNWNGLLTEPCGQREGECDYIDLIPESRLYHVLEEQGHGTRRRQVARPGSAAGGATLYTEPYSHPGGRTPPAARGQYQVPPDRRPPPATPEASRPPSLSPGQRATPQAPGHPSAQPPEGVYQLSQGLYQAPPGVSGGPHTQPPAGVYQLSQGGLYHEPYQQAGGTPPPLPSRTYDAPRDSRTGLVTEDATPGRMTGRPLPTLPERDPPSSGGNQPLVPARGEVFQRLLENQNQHDGSGQKQQSKARVSAARGRMK